MRLSDLLLLSGAAPFREAPRFWRGNMCGVRVPGLPPVDGGSSDPSLVLSWFYDRYNDSDRTRIRQAWKDRNLTHWLLSWPDSRAVGASPQAFANTCRELIRDGFYPCPFMGSKDYDPHDAQGLIANIAPVLPLLRGLVPLACIGFELNLWLSPEDLQTVIDYVAAALVPTKCRVYVHFSEGYSSWQVYGGHFADFWIANVGKLTGVLRQKVLTQTPDQYRDDDGGIRDVLTRFAGNFGVPVDSGFGHPFDDVECEITAAYQFDGSVSEANGNWWGNWAITTPPCTGPAGSVGVMGSGNGLD